MLGVSTAPEGYSFSLFSHNATSVILRLFHSGEKHPFLEKPMKKLEDIWSIIIRDLPETFEYTYRCDGPYDLKRGHLFNKEVDLLDPYAKRLSGPLEWNNPYPFPRGVIIPEQSFAWDNDVHPEIPLEELIIYETHVRGFTRDPSSHVNHPGTFLGMIEKIPHFIELGVNAVELLPVHTFNEREFSTINPSTGKQLCNYWGYSTANFFTPMRCYGTPEDLKTLIKELHRNKIEIILDVVYNHTSEGSCPNYYHSFRGIDNAIYYIRDVDGYQNYSGCGNTLNCNHPIVQQLIIDSLRTFVVDYHVDGFRFDLAPILTRGLDGSPMKAPPLIDKISRDPILGLSKLIAEPWDVGGLYQVGSFPSKKFGEWNDQFRDQIRHFIRGTGDKGIIKQKLTGSPELYRSPYTSYNFVTIHDGFSMYDLVSYNQKHNEINGEKNQDGTNNNISWNCGVEGTTYDREILTLRKRQVRNFFVALLLSQGIPMILMGDEYGHTKQGNNNTWCQDNALNYFLWDKLAENHDLFLFVAKLISIRKAFLMQGEVQWYDEPDMPFLAYMFNNTLLIAFNPSAHPFMWKLPKKKWKCLIDTNNSLQEGSLMQPCYTFSPYSSIVLIAI